MKAPTTLPDALAEIEELRGQVRDLLQLLGQEAKPRDTEGGASPVKTTDAHEFSEGLVPKQAGKDAAQHLLNLHQMIETVPDIIFTLDLQGNLVGWNKRLQLVTGFTPQELNGRPALSFVPEHEHAQTAAAIQRAFEEGYAELEGHLLTKDGRTIPYHWTGARLHDPQGRMIGLTGVGRDITERKMMERQRQEQTERLRLAMEIADLATWDWDISTNKVIWSENYEQVKRLAPGTFDGTFEAYQQLLHPDDLPTLFADINRALVGPDSYHTEHRIVPPGGDIQWIEGNGAVYRDEMGRPIRMIGTARNITERKRMEDERRKRETLLSLMLQTGPGCIKRVAADGTLLEMNQAGLRMIEMEEENAVGCCVFDVIAPEHRASFIDMHQAVLTGATRTLQVEIQGARGTRRWIETYAVPFLNPVTGSTELLSVTHDITERKRTEALLRTSEENLRQALHASNTGLWDWNTETNEVRFSREWKKQLGYEDEELPDSFETWETRLHPDDRARAIAYAQAYVAHPDGEYQQEFRLRHREGTYLWIAARASFVMEPDGRQVRLLGSHVDITDRKQTESALQQSEAHFRALIEHSSDILTVLDLDGRIRFESPSFERLLGYAQHEIDGLIAFDFIHPDDLPTVLAKFQLVMQRPGEAQTAEFRFRHKDGSWLILEGIGRSIFDTEGQRCVIVNSRDVSERKHAEEALHISQGRYARATAVGKVGVWELDVTTGAYHGDVNLKALFGYGEDELSTDPYVWLNLVHPDDRCIAMEHWQRIVRGEADGYSYELRMVRKDGAVIWTEVRGQAVRNNEGQVKHLFGATVDITERKRTDQVLREREETLARFKATLDQVHDCVFMFAADSLHFVYCNRGAVMQVGYTEDELATMTPLDIKPEFTERTFRELLKPLQDGSRAVQVFETVHRHKDGHDVAVEVSLQFVAETGREELCVAVVRDITERKQAQETLRLSEERFRSLFENSPIAYQSLDREGRFIDVNQRLCHLLGYEKEELLGSDFGDLWAGNVQNDFSATFEAFKNSGKVRNELALRRRDGTIVNAVIDGRIQRDQNGGFIRTHCILTDITERAQAEEALRRSEARLKEAQRIAHIGSWELDLVTNRLTWSDEIYRIFEIDSASFGASYEAFLLLVHPDDRTLVNQAYTESVTTRTPYNITHRLLMPDGRIKFVREQCETQYGRDGFPLCSSGTVQDITKQKEAEEALAHNHALLSAIMDASIDLIYIKDLHGRYVHINRAGAEAVGMSAEAVIGWDDVALWGGELAVSRRTSDRFVVASGDTITVEEQGTLLGNIAYYLTTKAPYRDSEGKIIGVIGIARNITEWKRVEEERQKALTLLTNVINATPDLIFVKDRDLRTLLCNNSFAQAIGKTPEDVIGRSDIENGWDPEHVRGNPDAGILGYESDDREALAGKVVHNSSDPVNVHGEVRIYDTYKVPLRDETGEVIGILGVSRDVTESKRMEEILRQRERDVRAAVEERERISEDLHDGILQSIFAVGLGLESCRTLVSQLPLPRKKTSAPLMAALNSAIGQLNYVMTDVRDFIAGIESNVLQGGDVGSTLRTMVQAMCASNGTACRVKIEEAVLRELSTEQAYHVINIVREALSNSLRHSGAGRISLTFKQLHRSLRLSVTDNGEGFTPDSVRDVGHGLVNMRARARKLGGHVEVRSWPRKGTKVLLDMPRRSADA